MDQILVAAVVRGLTSAAAIVLFIWCIRPALVWHLARQGAVVVAGITAVAPAALMLAGSFVPVPTYVPLAAYGLLLVAWLWPKVLVVATGGPRNLPRPIVEVRAASARILEHLEVGALDEAEREARAMDLHRTPDTTRAIDLWQRRVEEERQRNAGVLVSSRPTMQEIVVEWGRMLGAPPLDGMRARRIVAVALAGVIGASSALVDGRACIGVERMILTATVPSPGGTLPLDRAIAAELEAGSLYLYDEPMGLALAADSRHDPETRELLVEAGFVSAHARGWTASDGLRIQADVFEFEDQAGALRFQHAVNRYACLFANEAFDGPLDGIGLQVRREKGDPIEEQVSWVVGSRRYLVSIRALDPPVDHARVLRLVHAAEALSIR